MSFLSAEDKEIAIEQMVDLVVDENLLDACIEAVDTTPRKQTTNLDDPGVYQPVPSRKSVRTLIAEVQGIRPEAIFKDSKDKATYLVDLLGIDLLAQREIRHALIHGWDRANLERFWAAAGQAEDAPDDLEEFCQRIASYKWHPGKAWARNFARNLDLPEVFAGVAGSPPAPEVEEFETFVALSPLEPFQEDMANRIKAILKAPPGQNRGVLTMPTGSGKTRTVVEAVLDWWATERHGQGRILWIAQSDELCEQAVQAFRQVWVDRGHRGRPDRRVLRVARLWGTRSPASEADIIVASVQKLASVFRQPSGFEDRDALDLWASELAVVLLDEAHHGVAKSYKVVLRELGIEYKSKGLSNTPLIGLTATPYRTLEEESGELAAYFDRHLITPLGFEDDALTSLRDMGVLAKPEHQVIHLSGGLRPLTAEEHRYIAEWQNLPATLVRDLGDSPKRNRLILDAMLQMDPEWSVLFFGCTIQHAQAVATMLRRKGRTAEAILGSTRSATRRDLIERFRSGEIKFLCNYGVLTTGFDAPIVRAVVVARPTISPVLYEQMIGRGMRGPRFGGTERCLVVDVQDNLAFNGQMAWKRYEDRGYWRENPVPSHTRTAGVAYVVPQASTEEAHAASVARTLETRESRALRLLWDLQLVESRGELREKWLALARKIASSRLFRSRLIYSLYFGCHGAMDGKTLVSLFKDLVPAHELVYDETLGNQPRVHGSLQSSIDRLPESLQLNFLSALVRLKDIPDAMTRLRDALHSLEVKH